MESFKKLAIACLLLFNCGGGGGENGVNNNLDADIVLLQDGVGVGYSAPEEFREYVNLAYRFGREVWSDTEICYFNTRQPFSREEISHSIDLEQDVVTRIEIYCLSCLNEDNYDNRISAAFVYNMPLSVLQQKLQQFSSINTIIVQYWHYEGIDTTPLIDWLVNQGYNVIVGLNGQADWWNKIKDYKKHAQEQKQVIDELYARYGNSIQGVYIPEEPILTATYKPLFDYYNLIIKYAHNLGYVVAISPYIGSMQ